MFFSESNASHVVTTGFSKGIGEIWLNSVECFNPGFDTFSGCSLRFISEFSRPKCTHASDAGIRCSKS